MKKTEIFGGFSSVDCFPPKMGRWLKILALKEFDSITSREKRYSLFFLGINSIPIKINRNYFIMLSAIRVPVYYAGMGIILKIGANQTFLSSTQQPFVATRNPLLYA